MKLSGLSNISYTDKIFTLSRLNLFRRGTHEKVTLVKLAPESDFRLWHLEAESVKRISSVHPKATYSLISKKSNEVPTSDPIFFRLDRSPLGQGAQIWIHWFSESATLQKLGL